MPVKPPTVDELARIAKSYFLDCSSEDLSSFQALLG
jgi:hypothetical protein